MVKNGEHLPIRPNTSDATLRASFRFPSACSAGRWLRMEPLGGTGQLFPAPWAWAPRSEEVKVDQSMGIYMGL